MGGTGMSDAERALLVETHAGVARIEERTRALPEIERRVASLEQSRSALAAGAGLIGGVVAYVFAIVKDRFLE